jgi:RNA polymerase sigma-70 factor (sigma-E family)
MAELAGDRLESLKRQAFLLCGDDDQAEDLAQDALVRAFARPLRVPRQEAAEAYVRKIMVNLFIDGVRRQSRWSRKAPLLAGTETVPDPADGIVTRQVVQTALGCLSARQRACVVLRYYEDLPVTQIAAELGIREGTVKRYLSEAVAKLGTQVSPIENR